MKKNKDEIITIYLSVKEKKKIQRDAKKKGYKSTSEYVRKTIGVE